LTAVKQKRKTKSTHSGHAKADETQENLMVRLKSEEKFKNLFENAVDPILILDRKGRSVEANAKVHELLGYSKKNLIGKNFITGGILSKKSTLITLKNFAKRMAGFDVKPYEVEVIKKNHEILIGEINAAPLRENGRIVGDVVIVRDVTWKKEAEKALRERANKLTTLYELAELVETPGISLEGIFRGSVKLIPLTGQHPKDTCARLVIEGKEFKSKNFRETKWRYSSKVNDYGVLEVFHFNKISVKSGAPFLKEEKKLISLLTERLGKIIERIKAKESLKQSEKEFRDLFENANELIQSVGPNSKFIYVNKKWRKLLGYSNKEIKDLNLSDVLKKDQQESHLKIFNQVRKGKSVSGIETVFVSKNGTEIPVEGNVNAQFTGKKFTATRAIFRDVTERRKAEEIIRLNQAIIVASVKQLQGLNEKLQKTYSELRSLDELKNDFMNIAAHELKTPLIPILGYLKMALDGDMGKLTAGIVYRNAKRQQTLIEDIVDISKLEGKAMKFEMRRTRVPGIIRRVATDLKPLAIEKKLYLKTKLPQKMRTVTADKRRITQVLTNLVENAVNFTEKGGITIKAWEKKNCIAVSVKDTGVGIPANKMDKLFTKFFQADTSVKRRAEGTGLGLAISRGIIESHGGKINAKSVQGKGSTFYFTIPLKPPKKPSEKFTESLERTK